MPSAKNLKRKMEYQIVSGVGCLTSRIGSDISTIEKAFPLPTTDPIRFEKSFYPRYTDALFIKAIFELSGRKLSLKDLDRIPAYCRMSSEQKNLLITKPIREVFVLFESQFKDHPDIVETFIKTASRYLDPLPSFEIDFRYGCADLLCGRKLTEMKSYSVMTRNDLINARNQVLSYACLAKYTGHPEMIFEEIEVVNALTGEFWIWNCSEFFQSGEADRFYWTFIYPLISNNTVDEDDIIRTKNLYEQNIPGIDQVLQMIGRREFQQTAIFRKKLGILESQLKIEIEIRQNIVAKYCNKIEKRKEEVDEDIIFPN